MYKNSMKETLCTPPPCPKPILGGYKSHNLPAPTALKTMPNDRSSQLLHQHTPLHYPHEFWPKSPTVWICSGQLLEWTLDLPDQDWILQRLVCQFQRLFESNLYWRFLCLQRSWVIGIFWECLVNKCKMTCFSWVGWRYAILLLGQRLSKFNHSRWICHSKHSYEFKSSIHKVLLESPWLRFHEKRWLGKFNFQRFHSFWLLSQICLA